MIKAEGLRKRFGRIEALKGVDLEVPRGTVCCLLGPNGAGKTTLVRILTTLLTPDGGRAEVAGCDVVGDAALLRHRIGLAGQYAAVDELLTGHRNLTLFGRLCHLSRRTARRRADELLERFGLTEAAHRPVSTYSGGMRRRLDLAASLITAPPVLFLDEPTTGLDPRSRLALWDLLRELVAEGTTLLLTTQYLEEADRLADRIAVIAAGRVVACGSPSRLKAEAGGERVSVAFREAADLARGVEVIRSALPGEVEVDRGERRITVSAAPGTPAAPVLASASSVAPGERPAGPSGTADGVAALITVAAALDAAGIPVDDLSLRRPTLDEVFLRLTEVDAA